MTTEDKNMRTDCSFRFDSIEEDIREIKNSHDKRLDWLQSINDAVTRLATVQENQQTTLENQQGLLRDQAVAQNRILSELLEFEKIKEKNLVEMQKGQGEISAKKIVAIATIVSTTITAVATVLVALLS
jgi:hypothetical protein